MRVRATAALLLLSALAACGPTEEQQQAATEVEGLLGALPGVVAVSAEPDWQGVATLEVDVADDIAPGELAHVVAQVGPSVADAGLRGVAAAELVLADVTLEVDVERAEGSAALPPRALAERAVVAEAAFDGLAVVVRDVSTALHVPAGSGRIADAVRTVAEHPELSTWERWSADEPTRGGALVLSTAGRVTRALAQQWDLLHNSIALPGLEPVSLELSDTRLRAAVRLEDDPDLASVTPNSHPVLVTMLEAQAEAYAVSSRPSYVVEVYGPPAERVSDLETRTLVAIPGEPGWEPDPGWTALAERLVAEAR
ncbi:hypothetical protein [Nocardioides sp. TF02-7]|uniref:hypothetical protein n=1 Tax=Nocardioides sp. TF02-7 TaxID=2917724 RepID=UPI001F0530A1|nr:hypothetical protein [Nocardioides sp. TF02-7]UMG91474.1 hypothetical protein MF408_15240 [Nocardioides sp. TF02-7]